MSSLGSIVRELTVEPLTSPPPYRNPGETVLKFSGASPPTPDSIDPVWGWRAWRLHSTRYFDRTSLPVQNRRPIWGLQSVYATLYDQHLWPFGNPLTAECISFVKHDVPSRECNCGLSAFHRPADLVTPAPTLLGSQLSVIGQVVGWGHVIEHERGWRASLASPVSLGVICTHCRIEKQELRRAVYVVYWGPNKKFTLALCARHGNYLKRKGQVRNRALDFVSAQVVEKTLYKRYRVNPVGLWGLDHGYRVWSESETHRDTLWPQLVNGTHGPVQFLDSESDSTDCAECGSVCGECACSSGATHRGGE